MARFDLVLSRASAVRALPAGGLPFQQTAFTPNKWKAMRSEKQKLKQHQSGPRQGWVQKPNGKNGYGRTAFEEMRSEVNGLTGYKKSLRPGKGPGGKEKARNLEFETMRTEVYKLGTSKISKNGKRKAEIEKLIKLGARPKKNPSMNYRQLKDMLQRKALVVQKEKELIANGKVTSIQDKKKLQSALSCKQTVKKVFTKRKTERGGILEPYGKPGKVAYKKKKKHGKR